MDRGKMRGKCGEKRENETRRERRGYTRMGRRRDNVCAGRRARVRERERVEITWEGDKERIREWR